MTIVRRDCEIAKRANSGLAWRWREQICARSSHFDQYKTLKYLGVGLRFDEVAFDRNPKLKSSL